MKTPIWIEQETYEGYKSLLEKYFNGNVTEDQVQQYFREFLDGHLRQLQGMDDDLTDIREDIICHTRLDEKHRNSRRTV